MDNNIVLETKLVADIKGAFYVPSYQRGYRWGEDEVNRLLDDVFQNGQKNYCLQPVVVRKKDDAFELVDGQQRLTTILLSSNESFDNCILDSIISNYIAECENNSIYPWTYYYVKYSVFRPGSYGKLSNNDIVSKPYLFSIMQTKSQWSQNTYIPYLKEADDLHLSRDSMGQRLDYPDKYITCDNAAYLIFEKESRNLIEKIEILQNNERIDTEDRIIKLKRYLETINE